MGTRALVIPFDEDGAELCTIYRQFDGYPTGLGSEIAEILSGRHLVNGIGANDRQAKSFNGMGCLAASLIGSLKQDIGNVYIHPPGTRKACEEYIYAIRAGGGTPRIEVYLPLYSSWEGPDAPADLSQTAFYRKVFEGSPEQLGIQAEALEASLREPHNALEVP